MERLYREVRAYAIPGGSEEILLDLAVRPRPTPSEHVPNLRLDSTPSPRPPIYRGRETDGLGEREIPIPNYRPGTSSNGY